MADHENPIKTRHEAEIVDMAARRARSDPANHGTVDQQTTDASRMDADGRISFKPDPKTQPEGGMTGQDEEAEHRRTRAARIFSVVMEKFLDRVIPDAEPWETKSRFSKGSTD